MNERKPESEFFSCHVMSFPTLKKLNIRLFEKTSIFSEKKS